MKSEKPKKLLTLKLGGACNLKCKHCHCSQSNYEFNSAIVAYIRNGNFTRVTFCGGEPTLYYETVKKVVGMLPDDMEYKLVTNATKLTNEMVEYFNNHNFTVVASYDGENDSRDRHLVSNWRAFSKLRRKGISTLYSECNSNYLKLRAEIDRLLLHIGDNKSKSLWLNFPHQTSVNRNEEADKELAKRYCQIIGQSLEADFIRFKSGDRQGLNVLWMSFNKWGKKKVDRGVACCNENKHSITLDGRFLLCPYGQDYVGDLTTGLDYNKVESYIPDRCKRCEQWEYCGNSCIANITNAECYIARVLHKHLFKLMEKYQVTYEELLNYETS